MPDATPTTNSAEPSKDLGEYLKHVRQALGMSLRDVEVGTEKAVSNGSLSQIENGHTKRPTPNVLYNLATLYGLDYGDLLQRAGHHTPSGTSANDDLLAELNIPLRAITELSAAEQSELLDYIRYMKHKRSPQG